MIAQAKIVTADYAAHLQTLAEQGSVSRPFLEAYLITGAEAGDVIQLQEVFNKSFTQGSLAKMSNPQ